MRRKIFPNHSIAVPEVFGNIFLLIPGQGLRWVGREPFQGAQEECPPTLTKFYL
jgi:hypothetical protein